MTTVYEYIDRNIAENAKYLENELNLEAINCWVVIDHNGNMTQAYGDEEIAEEESRDLFHELTSDEIRALEAKGTIRNICAMQIYLNEDQVQDILDDPAPAEWWVDTYIHEQKSQDALQVYSPYDEERAKYEERARLIEAYATEIAERDLAESEYPDCTVDERAQQISTEVGRALAGSLVDLWMLVEEFEGYLRF